MLTKKLLSQLLDGTLTDKGACACGLYMGYYTVLDVDPATRWTRFSMAAHSAQDPSNTALNSLLSSIQMSDKAVKSFQVSENCVTFSVYGMTGKSIVQAVNRTAPRLADHLRQAGYQTGCMVCGSNDRVECYTINGKSIWLCPACLEKIQQELSVNQTEVRSQKSDLALGAVGAFIGACAGVVVYVLLAKLGYVAAITGVVMALLSMFLYEKFGGCLDLKGVICCAVITLAMVCVANRISWAWDAYSALKDYGWTFTECFKDIHYIIGELDLKSDYLMSLLSGLFFTLLGSAGRFVVAFRSSTGSFSIKKN